ncbi:MAG: prephenate/arogenate dehydrogenase family protein [Alphaproteobacteria bacterium]|nr:prephenate/arogenate dehydrogenase family protein [Alphaproteobacteria bacterium]
MKPVVGTLAIIGFGLIGSSIARAVRSSGAARRIVACDGSAAARQTIRRLKLADRIVSNPVEAVTGADMVVICTPVSAYARIARTIGRHLKRGAILTDAGSVKRAAIDHLAPHVPAHAHLVPAHPIAGTENSGPESGFAELFKGRWWIVTPPPGTSKAAVATVESLWRRLGSRVTRMTPQHHDRVLAITSHVPHLIAYTIVNTASDLESTLQTEVFRYSASGFRDFTRVAASSPIMWRDIFLANKDAVLEMLGRLYEDIALMQKAIRHDEGATLQRLFTKARRIRRGVVAQKQD